VRARSDWRGPHATSAGHSAARIEDTRWCAAAEVGIERTAGKAGEGRDKADGEGEGIRER